MMINSVEDSGDIVLEVEGVFPIVFLESILHRVKMLID